MLQKNARRRTGMHDNWFLVYCASRRRRFQLGQHGAGHCKYPLIMTKFPCFHSHRHAGKAIEDYISPAPSQRRAQAAILLVHFSIDYHDAPKLRLSHYYYCEKDGAFTQRPRRRKARATPRHTAAKARDFSLITPRCAAM